MEGSPRDKLLGRNPLIKVWTDNYGKSKNKRYGVPFLYMLWDTPMLSSAGKYFHEMNCAYLYLILHEYVDSWTAFFQFPNGKKPDRVFEFGGTRFYLEMDMGTEDEKTIIGKIESYRKMAGQGEKVIFLLNDGSKFKARSVGEWITSYCEAERLGDFVTASYYEEFYNTPFNAVLRSPKSGLISIEDLCQPLNG